MTNRTHLSNLPLFLLALTLASCGSGAFDDDPKGFGTDGTVSIAVPGLDLYAAKVEIASDGKIMVFGTSSEAVVIARYNSDGTPDETFSTAGVTSVPHPEASTADIEFSHFARDSEGRILVSGNYYSSATRGKDGLVGRLLANGTPDTTFGGDGFVHVDSDNGNTGHDWFYDLMELPSGKIAVTGRTGDPNSATNRNAILVRLLSDGSIDTTYGTNGRDETFDSGTNENYFSSMAASGEKIFMGGIAASTLRFAEFDSTFARAGFNSVSPSFSALSTLILGKIALTSDGKIVGVGTARVTADPDSKSNVLVLRLNGDGSLDTAFGGTGYVTTDHSTSVALASIDVASGVAIQSDGKIVTAGHKYVSRDSVLASRYNVDGTVDTSFGVSGHFDSSSLSSDDCTAVSTAIQANGRVLIAGSCELGEDYQIRVYRLLANGAIDKP